MNLGVVGSKHNALSIGYEIGLMHYEEITRIISAGMNHDDGGAEYFAKRHGIPTYIVPTEAELYREDAERERDLAIVELSEKVILLTDSTKYFIEVWHLAMISKKFLEGNMVTEDSPFYRREV